MNRGRDSLPAAVFYVNPLPTPLKPGKFSPRTHNRGEGRAPCGSPSKAHFEAAP